MLKLAVVSVPQVLDIMAMNVLHQVALGLMVKDMASAGRASLIVVVGGRRRRAHGQVKLALVPRGRLVAGVGAQALLIGALVECLFFLFSPELAHEVLHLQVHDEENQD